jgi:hypothetical protein
MSPAKAQRRKGAKAQRKPLRNAVALCAFAPLRLCGRDLLHRGTFRAKLGQAINIVLLPEHSQKSCAGECSRVFNALKLAKGRPKVIEIRFLAAIRNIPSDLIYVLTQIG